MNHTKEHFHLAGLPAEERIFSFPKTIRLVVTHKCNLSCSFPTRSNQNRRRKWCHSEGLDGTGLQDTPIKDYIKAACLIRDSFQVRSVRLAGLEATLREDLCDFIRALRSEGFEDISLSTNGTNLAGLVASLKKAGLGRINISLPSFDRFIYQRITGRDSLNDVLTAITTAQDAGFAPVKVNRLLLRGFDKDIPSFLEWAYQRKLTVRFHQLLWSESISDIYYRYHVPWQQYLPKWLCDAEKISVNSYLMSGRSRFKFALRNGAFVEADQFTPQLSLSCCRNCQYNLQCPGRQEGVLGCGFRVTPSLRLTPCMLRASLSIPLIPLLNSLSYGVHDAVSELYKTLKSILGVENLHSPLAERGDLFSHWNSLSHRQNLCAWLP